MSKTENPISVIDRLSLAWSFIGRECDWIKNGSAQDIYGEPVAFSSPRAAKFCICAALKRADLNCHKVFNKVLPDGFDSVPAFNEHPDTTYADVMALFHRAMEKM